jgi:hypothetical protein
MWFDSAAWLHLRNEDKLSPAYKAKSNESWQTQ